MLTAQAIPARHPNNAIVMAKRAYHGARLMVGGGVAASSGNESTSAFTSSVLPIEATYPDSEIGTLCCRAVIHGSIVSEPPV